MVTHHPHKWAVVTAIRWEVKPRKNSLQKTDDDILFFLQFDKQSEFFKNHRSKDIKLQ